MKRYAWTVGTTPSTTPEDRIVLETIRDAALLRGADGNAAWFEAHRSLLLIRQNPQPSADRVLATLARLSRCA